MMAKILKYASTEYFKVFMANKCKKKINKYVPFNKVVSFACMVLKVNNVTAKLLISVNANTTLPSFGIQIRPLGMKTKFHIISAYDTSVVILICWEVFCLRIYKKYPGLFKRIN